jgi:hypothetical protein
MQDDPIAGSANGDPPPRHRHQLKRWLLLELVSYPRPTATISST